MSSGSKGQERIEYLGEVSRTEIGRRESVVRGESKTKTTTGFTTTQYTTEGQRQSSNVKTYTSGNTGFGNTQGHTTGLTEVSRQIVGQSDSGYKVGPITTKETSW